MAQDEVTVDDSDGSFVTTPWAIVVTFLCVCLVLASTAWNCYWHLVNYTRPELQSHILRIIVIAPIFTVGSFLCLVAPGICFTVRCFTDIWEAVVIYSFLMLIIEYMGGEHLCLTAIAQREEGIAHAWPLNYCFAPMKVENMIRIPKRWALQFVILKPMMAIISVVVYACGKYKSEIYQWTLFLIYNVSYTVALYALFLIYTGSKNHPSLVPRKPLVKFIVVKGVIFFTFWQSIVLPWFVQRHTEKWENFVFVVEFLLFAFVMNFKAFVWSEFQDQALKDNPQGSAPQDADGTGSNQAANGTGTVPNDGSREQPVPQQGWRKNARSAFSPKDVVNDASRSFSSRYTRHVLLESAQEYVIEGKEEEKNEDENGDGPKAKAATQSAGTRRYLGKTFLFGSKTISEEVPVPDRLGSPQGTVLGNSQLPSPGIVSLEPQANGDASGIVSLEPKPEEAVTSKPTSSATPSTGTSRPAQDQV